MTSPRRRCLALLLAAGLLALPSTAGADLEGKGGFFDLSFERARVPGTRTVQWLWWPYYEVGSVPLVVYASCERFSADDRPVGKNKITFKNVTLRGVDTDTVVSFRKRKVRLRNGEHEIVTWDAAGALDIATETVVIGRADVQIKNALAAFDWLRCELGLAELTGEHATAAARPEP